MRIALRRLKAENQHVLGQPAFLAGLPGGQAQRMALLAQQRVAAVARAVGLDRQFLGEMHDEAAVGIEFAGGVQAAHEGLALRAFAFDAPQRRRAHPGHQAHVGHHVGRIGDLHPAPRQRRVQRPHAVGNHVQGAPAHAAVKQRIHLRVRLAWRHPMIVRAGRVALARAHEGEMFDARDIVRIGAVQPASRMGFRIEAEQAAVGLHSRQQRLVFGVAAVAPVEAVGPGERRHLGDPLVEGGQPAARRRRCLRSRYCVHCSTPGQRRCAENLQLQQSMRPRASGLLQCGKEAASTGEREKLGQAGTRVAVRCST